MSRALKITSITHQRDIPSSESRMYERFRSANGVVRDNFSNGRISVELEAEESPSRLSLTSRIAFFMVRRRPRNIQSVLWIIRRRRFRSLRAVGSRRRVAWGNEGRLRGLLGFRLQVVRLNPTEYTDGRFRSGKHSSVSIQRDVHRDTGECELRPLSYDKSYATSRWSEAKRRILVIQRSSTFGRRFMRVIMSVSERKRGYSEDVRDLYNRTISCVPTWNWNECRKAFRRQPNFTH